MSGVIERSADPAVVGGKCQELHYDPDYLPDSKDLLDWLLQQASWCDEHLTMFGRVVKAPRQICWFGDRGLNYRYAGLDHAAQGWPQQLGVLRDRINNDFKLDCNFVLLNRYANGASYMGWHRDNETSLIGPVISISLGATRRFLLQLPDAGATADKHRLDLEHGSLLKHPGHWRHSLPKTRKPVATRINLSFRCVRDVSSAVGQGLS